MDYEFRIQARSNNDPGPFCDRVLFRTERDIVRAPMNVKAMPTSYSSVEVWWLRLDNIICKFLLKLLLDFKTIIFFNMESTGGRIPSQNRKKKQRSGPNSCK